MALKRQDAVQSNTTVTRRAALGELGNRVKNTIVETSKIGNHIIKPTTLAQNLKVIKPRVDTHWKRDEPIALAKRVTRTNSLKSTSTTSSSNPANVRPKLVKTKTVQTAKLEEAVKIQIPRVAVAVTRSKFFCLCINQVQQNLSFYLIKYM